MAIERERFALTDNPLRICHTAHDRMPYLTNVGDADIVLDIKDWPAGEGVTLAPGMVVPFPNPRTPADATPIWASAPSGSGAVEYLFLR